MYDGPIPAALIRRQLRFPIDRRIDICLAGGIGTDFRPAIEALALEAELVLTGDLAEAMRGLPLVIGTARILVDESPKTLQRVFAPMHYGSAAEWRVLGLGFQVCGTERFQELLRDSEPVLFADRTVYLPTVEQLMLFNREERVGAERIGDPAAVARLDARYEDLDCLSQIIDLTADLTR